MKKVVPLIVALSSLLLILPGLWMIGKLAISFWFPEHWTGQKAGGIQPLLINAGALLLFGLQHSLLARKSAKDFLQKYFSPPIIRSFYVLTSGWALGIMGWVWHQHPHTLWELQPGLLYWGLLAVSAGGLAVGHARSDCHRSIGSYWPAHSLEPSYRQANACTPAQNPGFV